jgi:hypothetical protein
LNLFLAIADRWFPPHEALTVVSIGSFANVLGYGVGFIIPAASMEKWDNIPTLLIIEAVIATTPVIMALPFMRESPKYPPSFCAVGENLLSDILVE